jgi:hypothetical protein
MRQNVALFAAAILISGCDSQVSAAKQAVADSLIDPGSVQYRNVASYSEGVVCGEVNAKNRMGGYTGFRRFVYNGPRKDAVEIIDDADRWTVRFCNNEAHKRARVELEAAQGDLLLAKAGCSAGFGADCVRAEKATAQVKALEAEISER